MPHFKEPVELLLVWAFIRAWNLLFIAFQTSDYKVWLSQYTQQESTMKISHTKLLWAVMFGLASGSTPVYAGAVRHLEDTDHVPTGKGHGEFHSQAPKRYQNQGSTGQASTKVSLPQNGIYFHGGSVMGVSSPVNVYYIWYGNWSGNNAAAILDPLAANIGGSPRFNINTTYTDRNGNKIANNVIWKGEVSSSYNYTQGVSLTDNNVAAIVNNAISTARTTPAGKLPLDPNGVYFVLTSKDVKESSGFCTRYCGWHSAASIGQQIVKFAFVGDPSTQCPNSCSAQGSTGPNGNAGADAMASVIVHELEESVTDPLFNAWYDNSGYENSDKCAWQFGAVSKAGNGAYYNVNLGGLNYLIQQNWANSSSPACVTSY